MFAGCEVVCGAPGHLFAMAAMHRAAAVADTGHGVARTWFARRNYTGLPSYMSMEGADAAECPDRYSKCINKHVYYYNYAINF